MSNSVLLPAPAPRGRAAKALAALLLAALAVLLLPAGPAAAATVLKAEGETGALSGWYMRTLADTTASGGSTIKYEWTGAVTLKVVLPADADGVALRVRGDQCDGAPAYTLTVDNVARASTPVTASAWTTQAVAMPLVAGTHTLEIRYANDLSVWGGCDRNLYLDAISFTSSGTALRGNPALPAGFVHQAGTGLLDGAGRTLKLRGVNVGGWLMWEGWIFGRGFDYVSETPMMKNLTGLVGATAAEQFRSDVRSAFATAADFRAMSAYGLNAARIPFSSRLLEDDAAPGAYKASGWAVLDRLVADAKAGNVYLVLDLQSAPCSQSYSFTSDYTGPDFLWFKAACQDRTVALWKAIAARYANENVIAGYDLLNESVTTDANLLALYTRITAAIRSVDRNHLLIYEGNSVARTFDFMPAPLDANQMLSFHDYTSTTPGTDVAERMPIYDAAARRLGSPQWAGEFGQASYATVQHYVDTFAADPLLAGWAQWTWKQSGGLPALQTIQHTAASQKLIDFIDNPSRPRPTAAEAAQGMTDFVRAIRFENTTHDAKLRAILTGR
jgi:hypothetical protein